MELTIDLSVDILDEKYNIFLDKISEENYLDDYIKKILEFENINSERPFYISILITNNENIRIINRNFRKKDSATDVISFAYHESDDFEIGPYDTLGDIIISLERVDEQSKEYGHSFEREFFYVLTHGVLHILGYDHIEEEDKKIMREREEKILNFFGYTRES